MKKVLVVLAAALAMSACSESVTAPAAAKKAPTNAVSRDFTCRSGYVVAYDEDSNPYCVPDEHMMVRP